MMHESQRIVFILSLILLLNLSLLCGEEQEKETKFYSSSTSLSLLMTSGNTREFTMGLDTEQNIAFKKNAVQFKGTIFLSQSKGIKKSEFYDSLLEYKRIFFSKAYLLSIGRWERNVLSGYNSRLSLSAGGGYNWIKTKNAELSSEGTIGWSRENNIRQNGGDNISLSFASCQLSSKLKLLVSQTSELNWQEMVFLNLDDTKDYRIFSLASLSVKISTHLALKISYKLNYNHSPVPGFKSTDHYFLSSLVFTM